MHPTTLGAVHKLPHAIFDRFFLLPFLCHTLSHIWGPPPKVRNSSRTTQFLVVQTTEQKPSTKSHSIVRGGFCPGILPGIFLSGRFFPGWFLSVPPSVRIHTLQQKVKHHFQFQVSYV